MNPVDLVDYDNAVKFILANQNDLLDFLPRDIKEGSAYVLTRGEGSRLVDNLKWLKDKQRYNENGSTRTISFSDNETGLGRISWNNVHIGNKTYHIKAYVNLGELLDRLRNKVDIRGESKESHSQYHEPRKENAPELMERSKFWQTVLNPVT